MHGDYDVLLPAVESATEPTFDKPGVSEARLGLGMRLAAVQALWGLTPRQSEVLHHVVEGASNKEIADQLGCAENTVELHMTKLLQKAGLASRTRLIAQFWGGF
jgi:DNA-binding NarL/FixJ family response regulator